ncbi:hypothetical protein HOG21_07250 [bacterium]|nr:hypothetical protein [bacterium]
MDILFYKLLTVFKLSFNILAFQLCCSFIIYNPFSFAYSLTSLSANTLVHTTPYISNHPYLCLCKYFLNFGIVLFINLFICFFDNFVFVSHINTFVQFIQIISISVSALSFHFLNISTFLCIVVISSHSFLSAFLKFSAINSSLIAHCVNQIPFIVLSSLDIAIAFPATKSFNS